MKLWTLLCTILMSINIFADDCLDGGVRFRSFGDTGGGEMYLGTPDLGVALNRVETNFKWNSTKEPTQYPFKFTYDFAGNATSTVLSKSLTTTTPPPNVIDTLLINVASRDDGSSARLLSLKVNDQEFGDFGGPGQITKIFRVATEQFYTVTGIIELSGTFSTSQELSRIEVRLGEDECQLIPEGPTDPKPPSPPEQTEIVPTLTSWGTITMITLVLLVCFRSLKDM